jgi:hypothetical protein
MISIPQIDFEWAVNSYNSRVLTELRGDHASYIDNWLTILKSDKRSIFSAAAHASRAVDFPHGLHSRIHVKRPVVGPTLWNGCSAASRLHATVLTSGR